MKIGILTFHKAINYGAFMQAYALSTKLQEVFPNSKVEIIDYVAPKEKRKVYINILWTFKHYGISGGIKELKKIQSFNSSYKNLSLSFKKNFGSLKELYNYIEKNYQILIIGSDAVFNWNQNGFPSAFIPDYDFKIPVLTYAASVHGLSYFDAEQTIIEKCKDTFANMDSVYVRDECTEKFVKFCNSNVNPKHACDPTFLIDFKKLYKLGHRNKVEIFKKYKINEGNYIVLMLQDEKISRMVYNRYHDNYVIVSTFMNNPCSDVFLYDLTPIEWCLILKDASAVVTNYFHGTLLSLEQGVPTMVIDLSNYTGVYEGKLSDLMKKRLELPDLYFLSDEINNSPSTFFEIFDRCLEGDFKNQINVKVLEEASTFADFEKNLKVIINDHYNV
nr:polysaccharide pyruvyl transferase family protein [uncultured Blautia sp.]